MGERFPRTLLVMKPPPHITEQLGKALGADLIGDQRAGWEAGADPFQACSAFLRESGYEIDPGYLRQLYRAAAAHELEHYQKN